jgi:hypothetical protein
VVIVMTGITLWLLISVNSIYNNSAAGHYTVIERFTTLQDCEHVERSLPKAHAPLTRCIQARGVVR